MSYQVGVDLGAVWSAAAVSRPGRPAPEILPLQERSAFMPSVVFANADGSLLVGQEAQRQAANDPGRVIRLFKRRIGDGTPLRVGDLAITADEVAARFVGKVLDVAKRVGSPVTRVAVAHPAGWGPHRLVSLRAALAAQGMGAALLIPDSVAAVVAHSNSQQLDPGALVAVYDFGGGSFTASVVRLLRGGRFTLAGRPEELDVGGLDLDEAVFEHVQQALGQAWEALDPTDPQVLAGVAELRRQCVAAKEALSADTDVQIPVRLPGIETDVLLARAEFEEMIRPAVDETVAALHNAIRSAAVEPAELAAVLLIGGSSVIPLITQEVSAQLGQAVTLAADSKGIVALGAALAARTPEPELTAVEQAPAIETTQLLELAAPAWSRPPLPIGPGPADRRRQIPWRVVGPAVASAVLSVLLVAGGIAVANRPETAPGAGVGAVEPEAPSSTSPTPPSGDGAVFSPPVSSSTTPPPPPPTTRPTTRQQTTSNPPPPPPPRQTTTAAPTTTTPPTTTENPPPPTTETPPTTNEVAPTTPRAGAETTPSGSAP